MTPTYTPGPWIVSGADVVTDADDGPDARAICALAKNSHHKERGRSCFTLDDKDRANGRLIAAAPELLETLQAIINRVDEGPRSVAANLISDPHQIALKGSFLELVESARKVLAKIGD